MTDRSADAVGQPILEVRDVRAGYFAGHDIILGVDLEVGRAEVACVIGPNGAGKSTVFKALYGLVPVRSGRVLLDGRDITDITPQDARQGLEASDRGHVIEMGRISHQGFAADLLADPKVRRASLGAR